jgi:hypothetical protein
VKILPPDFTNVKHVLVGIDKLVPGHVYNLHCSDTTVMLRSGVPSGYELIHYYVVREGDNK